jgi:AraC-like DNA-binding protein
VILLTARADDESRLEGLGTGADDYLTKPFGTEELLARAENLIEVRRRLRRQLGGEVTLGPSEVVVSSAEAVWLEAVRDAVERRMGESSFTVDALARDVGLSKRQLQRRLRQALSLSPNGFIRAMRLERAAQLLRQRAGTVSEIAYRVGFNDAEYFSKLFRQVFGVVPSGYPEST